MTHTGLELGEGQAGLQQQLHALRREFDLKHNQNIDRLDKIEHTLDGNSRPGVVETVTKISAGISILAWLFVAMLVPVLTTTAIVISDHFNKH